MKKVLIASVGGSPEPIIVAIARSQPDFVYFLCSTGRDGSDAMVERTIVPRTQLAEGTYAIERAQAPHDLDDVITTCARIETDLDARFAGVDVDVTANFTGGTKTMSAGLVALATRRGWRPEQTVRISREWSGPVSKISLTAVTVFSDVEVACSPGINVIIGENGTGKTHLLKCAYALLRAAEEAERGLPMPTWGGDKLERVIAGRFRSFFEDERASTRVSVECGPWQFERVEAPGLPAVWSSPAEVSARALFLPSREVLTLGPKLVGAYLDRALPFDETYYDLCRELAQFELREPRPELAPVLEELERIFGGRVRLTDAAEFVVETQRGPIAAPMVAEGHRKLAVLAHLIRIGALTNETVLFWDEPESNLNPRLVTAVAGMLRKLASAGVQCFVATHDYLLARELSLAAEYKTAPPIDASFFAFHRASGDEPVEVEPAASFSHLDHNAIVDEQAAHYDRAQALFAGEAPEEAP